MSKVEVTEKVDPPSWRYAETGAFRIWSLLEDSDTQKSVAAELACWSSLPPALVELNGRRVVLIYTNQSLVVPNIPEAEELPKKDRRIGENLTLNTFIRITDEEVVAVANLARLIRNRAFDHDIARTVIGLNRDRMPLWLSEALIGRYGLFENGIPLNRHSEAMKLRQLEGWPELTEEDAAEIELVPMANLLSNEWPDAEEDPEAFDRWSAQAALFVQWLAGGRGEREEHWESFRRIATYSLHYPILEPAFAQETGYSFAEVEAELRRYLPRAVHINQIVRVPDVYHLGDLKLRTASAVSKDLVQEVKDLLLGLGEFEVTPE